MSSVPSAVVLQRFRLRNEYQIYRFVSSSKFKDKQILKVKQCNLRFNESDITTVNREFPLLCEGALLCNFHAKLSKHYVIIHNVWPDSVHTVIHVVDVDLFVSE